MPKSPNVVVRAPVLSILLLTAPLAAQDAPAGFTWENGTEFAFVTASGNQSSSTLGLKSQLTGNGPVSTFKIEVGGIRASSQFTDRTATGTATSFTITETIREEKSAENYFARSRFDRDLGENSFFAFGGAGWERNTFAGFNHRVSAVAGVGDALVDDDVTVFKADVGATYTIQKDLEPDPAKNDGFGGLRATLEYTRVLTESTDFASTLIADENLSNTKDLRLDWVASIAVALTEGLAFKTSYRLQFDNQPSLIRVPLFDASGVDTGTTVRVPGEKSDHFVTLSLVISL